jgi:hypothetical protein
MTRTMQTARRSSPELGNVAQRDPQPGTEREKRHGKVAKKKSKKSESSRKKLSEALVSPFRHWCPPVSIDSRSMQLSTYFGH